MAILERYDTIIKNALVKILNIQLPEDAWNQATLPVAKGGLGLRPATEVAIDSRLPVQCSCYFRDSSIPITNNCEKSAMHPLQSGIK